jgi:hypothetical protein
MNAAADDRTIVFTICLHLPVTAAAQRATLSMRIVFVTASNAWPEPVFGRWITIPPIGRLL